MDVINELHNVFTAPQWEQYRGVNDEPYLNFLYADPPAVAAVLRAELARRQQQEQEAGRDR